MSMFGNRVLVTTSEQYERMLAHPGSVCGYFDPTKGEGWVQFGSIQSAAAARREI